jgi:hypothetical protein
MDAITALGAWPCLILGKLLAVYTPGVGVHTKEVPGATQKVALEVEHFPPGGT